MCIKVAIADKYEVVRVGLKKTIEDYSKNIEIVKEASYASEILEFAKNSTADIYLLDILLPDLNGVILIKKLLKINSKSKIIVYTILDDPYLIEEIFINGAKGFLLKSDPTKQIIYAINEVYNGNYYISPGISGPIIEKLIFNGIKKRKHSFKLTLREIEVLQLICDGLSDKEIAAYFKISVNTVHVHKNHIMKKLNVHNVARLVRYAIKTKLIIP
ncbi:MAG: response regulator transcription factor [Spirochaetales bacterium]|nr:response regulator transcription factor [Spirochaetales bacterium]